jgi:L-histidine N-alpha-methyltransferase
MKTISKLDSEVTNRFFIHRLALDDNLDAFGRDVHSGLTSNPKVLLPKYFYDSLGSHLFEAICCLPEYYVSRAESEILREHTEEMIVEIQGDTRRSIRLVELGSGSAEKTRYWIKALLNRQKELHYVPVDISASILDRTCQRLLFDYPSLRVAAYAADYSAALRALARSPMMATDDKLNVVLFLGSSVGNLDPNEASALFREVRRTLRPGDALFLGADLKKSEAVLVPAYNDALGVTAAFNLNLLVRINRELAGYFDLAQFEHQALYNEQLGRIEMHVVSRTAQTVRIRAVDLEVSFERGESIHTENSYKFEASELSELARQTGFSLRRAWSDGACLFSFNFLAAV